MLKIISKQEEQKKVKAYSNLLKHSFSTDQIPRNLLRLRNSSHLLSHPFPPSRRLRDTPRKPLSSFCIPLAMHLLPRQCKNYMIHRIIIHVNFKTNPNILTWHHHIIIYPRQQILPALQLHCRQQPSTIPPPTRVEFKHGLPFSQQQRRIFAFPDT